MTVYGETDRKADMKRFPRVTDLPDSPMEPIICLRCGRTTGNGMSGR